MALWGNNDAVTVTPTGKVSLAYTDSGYTNVNAAGIGSTGLVLTGTATSFGNPGYGKTGDIIAIGFPKNTLGVGTYYGEAVIVGIAATNQISIAGTKIKEEPTPEAEPKVEPEESLSSDKTWHYVAISVTLFSALMSYNVANSYNDLSDKNKNLATQYANSSSSSEQASYKSEYDSNASERKS